MAEKVVSVRDMRRAAQRRLPRMIFDFIDGGALDELTLHENESDLARLRLRQRVLQDVSSCELATDVLDRRIGMPLMIAPMGLLGLFHPHGDLALARAAARSGTVFVHSAWSGWSVEDVVREAPGSTWSQLAFWTDAGITRDHIDRAAAAGIEVLVIAGDVAVSSKRERDLHHGLAMPPRPTQIPPPGLLAVPRRRPAPYLYSPDEMARVLHATRRLHPPLRAATYRTLLGLLAATGMFSRGQPASGAPIWEFPLCS